MPLSQLDDLRCKLEARGVSSNLYQMRVVPNNSNHAFGYWFDWDGVVGGGPGVITIGQRVESFFAQYLLQP
jgi:hypothetical protein